MLYPALGNWDACALGGLVCLPSTEVKVKGDFPKDIILFIFVRLSEKMKVGLKYLLLDGILIGLV